MAPGAVQRPGRLVAGQRERRLGDRCLGRATSTRPRPATLSSGTGTGPAGPACPIPSPPGVGSSPSWPDEQVGPGPVGQVGADGGARPLTLWWDGDRWRRVAAAAPRGSLDAGLTDVTALAPDDVWATGSWYDGTTARTFVERWDGSSWRVVPSPNPGSPADEHYLMGSVPAATASCGRWGERFDAAEGARTGSACDGTATAGGRCRASIPAPVSTCRTSRPSRPPTSGLSARWALAIPGRSSEHWDGVAWTRSASPDPGEFPSLLAVAAVTPQRAWAVGTYLDQGVSAGLVSRWNGRHWSGAR